MQYRRLGQTAIDLSVIGFGASPLGGVFGQVDLSESERAIAVAVDKGINFFDVSPFYGQTLAEERLGIGLVGKRDKVILATKCGRYGARNFDFSAKKIRAGVEESLRRLRTDYVDLLQAHDIEFGSTDQIIHETVPEMRRLQAEGKTRYIGITGYPLNVLKYVAEQVPVDSILSYCRYDLLVNDLYRELVPYAAANNIGIINASPLHMGVLTEAGPPAWHPGPSEVLPNVREALAFCREQNIRLSDVALNFCFSYPHVASTLVGMSNAQQVEENVAAYRATVPPHLLKQVRDILAPVTNRLWLSGQAAEQQ